MGVAAITSTVAEQRYRRPLMARRCARPDCHVVATTTLGYDYPESTVWIAALSEAAHPMTHDLCDGHADRLSVPRGWQLSDRRPVAPHPLAGADALAC